MRMRVGFILLTQTTLSLLYACQCLEKPLRVTWAIVKAPDIRVEKVTLPIYVNMRGICNKSASLTTRFL